MQKRHAAQLHQLRNLADRPAEQTALAVTLLNPRLGYEVIQAALGVLTKTVDPAARPALLNLYAYYDDKGADRDPAANLRAQTMRALRSLVEPADTPLLLKATTTFVFPPPSFKEEGAMLRSAALNALNEVEDRLARYTAIGLLANQHTDPMSGEPALTAARLLASHAEIPPLYFYVMQDGAQTVPEVLSECLRYLTGLPEAFIPALIERYADHKEDMVLVGLFDFLLNHQSGPHGRDLIRTFLRTTGRLDAYRYLVTVLVAAGRQELLDDLLAAAGAERQGEKVAILVRALSVLESNAAVRALLANLRARLAHRSA